MWFLYLGKTIRDNKEFYTLRQNDGKEIVVEKSVLKDKLTQNQCGVYNLQIDRNGRMVYRNPLETAKGKYLKAVYEDFHNRIQNNINKYNKLNGTNISYQYDMDSSKDILGTEFLIACTGVIKCEDTEIQFSLSTAPALYSVMIIDIDGDFYDSNEFKPSMESKTPPKDLLFKALNILEEVIEETYNIRINLRK